MQTCQFRYDLPEDLVAFYSKQKREDCRLMVTNRRSGSIQHKLFFELPEYMRDGDLLLLNDTKVVPARLVGYKENGLKKDVLLVERVNEKLWKCLVKNPKSGMLIGFNDDIWGKVLKNGYRHLLIEFNKSADDYIEKYGMMPLPAYIKRNPEDTDRIYYQTVYAQRQGAIAAPTAGLHFTNELLDVLCRKEVEIRFVTLHIGTGTFTPVKTEHVEQHKMHQEYREIPEATAEAVNRARYERRRIVAVGTTVVRAVESATDRTGRLLPLKGFTDLFIYPGFEFKIVDALITNFHLPLSSLLILISAFAGRDFLISSYYEAVREKYRFLSYGDAMLIV